MTSCRRTHRIISLISSVDNLYDYDFSFGVHASLFLGFRGFLLILTTFSDERRKNELVVKGKCQWRIGERAEIRIEDRRDAANVVQPFAIKGTALSKIGHRRRSQEQ